ncbi:MAG: hypothetical protein CL917_19455 [Deltaproteobacteria bacterium]|nr:hypothetical protein [Deltaproteobacteria bacterium]
MTQPSDRDQSALKENAQGALPFAALSGALQILLSLLGMLLLVRYLPPDQFGIWTVMLGFSAPIIIFTSFGFRHSLLRFLPAIENKYDQSRFLWAVVIRRVLWVILISLSLYFTFPVFAERIGLQGNKNVFMILLAGFPILSACQYLTIGLNVGFRQREVFIGSLISQFVTVGGVLLGIYLKKDLSFFATVQLVGNSIYLVFNLAVTTYYIGPPSWKDFKKPHLEDSGEKHYRRTSFVDDVGNSLLSVNTSRFIVAAFAATPQVAIYSFAVFITERLRTLMPLDLFRPLATVTFFTRHEQNGTIDEVNRMFFFLFAINRIVSTSFLVFFLPLGYQAIVWVFKPEYGESYLPIVFLLAYMALFSMPIGLVAQALQRPKLLVYSKVAVLVNIGLGIPMATEYGAAGMAFSTAISELIKSLIVFIFLRREFKIRYPWESTFRFLAAGLCVSLLLWWLDTAVHFLIAGGIGGLAWLAALRLFGVLSRNDRSLLISVLPTRFQGMASTLLGS